MSDQRIVSIDITHLVTEALARAREGAADETRTISPKAPARHPTPFSSGDSGRLRDA